MEKHLTLFLGVSPIILLLSCWFLPIFEEEAAPEYIPEVVAELSSSSCPCTVTQGSFTAPLPFMSTNSSATNFYSYSNPINVSANTGLEMPETFLLMIHEDLTTGSTSLMFILDQANDPTGGSANITFNCFPSSAFIALSDEPGEFSGAPPTFTGNFNWNACCTDGGIIGGFGCGHTVTINPSSTTGISFFSLVYGTPAAPIYVNMPQINCPITINCGGTSCCNETFDFSAIPQNATCSNSGDGSIDLTTDCAAAPIFQWSNGAFTEDIFGLNPGVYSVTITDLNGCSQTESFVISANFQDPQPSIAGPTEYCEGDLVQLDAGGGYSTYLWSNGSPNSFITVTNPGTYSVTVTNAFGCSGTATTTIIQNPVPMPEISGPTTICPNETITLDAGAGFQTYTWSTGDFSQTTDITEFGGYFVTVTNSFGCSSFDFHIVEPLPGPIPMISGPESLCTGSPIHLDAGTGFDSYLWSTGETSQTISTSQGGTFSVTVTDDSDCDGTASIAITENPTDSTMLFQTSCNPAETGLFVQQYTNQYDCDSMVWTTVTLLVSDTTELALTTCDPNQAGVFQEMLTNQNGCDSLVYTTVSLLPSDITEIQAYTCDPNEVGDFEENLINQYGCDSLVITTVNLSPSDDIYLNETTCDPNEAGDFEENLINQYGCDSTVYTTVNLLPIDTTDLLESTCDPNQAGQFEEVLTNQFGCDSLVITTVSLSPSDQTLLTDTTCDFNQAGVFETTLSNQHGCDSLVILTVNFLPSDTNNISLTSCNPDDSGIFESIFSNQYGCDSLIITTVNFSPNTDTTQLIQASCDQGDVGVFEAVLTNQFGCDSLVITTVNLSPSDDIYLNETTCDPNQTGVFQEILTNQLGCDSVVNTTVSLLPTDETFLTATTCDSAQVGVFQTTLINQFGCDSVVNTTVNLLPSDETLLTDTTCDPAQVGVFETTLSNQHGCDSLVVLTVNLLPSDTTELYFSSCNPNDAGTFETVFPNQFGCDSLVVTTITLSPSNDTTALFYNSCNPDDVGIFEALLPNQFGCDSIIITTISLLPSDEVLLEETTCDPNQAGVFQSTLINQFGCDSVVITTVSLLPSDETFLTDASCDPAQVGVFETTLSNQYGCDSLVVLTVNQLPSDTLSLFYMTCDSATVGTQSILYQNQFGCDSLVIETTELNPPDSCAVDIFLTVADADCEGMNGEINLTVTVGAEPFTYQWQHLNQPLQGTGTIPFLGQSVNIDGLPTGDYSITVIASNGLTTSTLATIIALPLPMVNLEATSDYNGFGVSCTGASDGSISMSAEGGPEPFLFQWSNGTTGMQADDLFAGSYTVTITNGAGCTGSMEIVLDEPPPLELALTVSSPDCFDLAGGQIIADVTGGVQPFEYSIDGTIFQASPEFTGLTGGAYTLTLRDANGCEVSEIILINVPVQLEVDLGEDQIIDLGETATLNALVNLPFDSLTSIEWSPLDSTECPECLTQLTTPVITTSYSVNIIADNGCADNDDITISVRRRSRIYVPNIFSPNGDGLNDVFMLFTGPEVIKINSFQVYSRWGEEVFKIVNALPNDPSAGWDGMYRGEPVNAAVFVYWAEVELIDGSLVTVKGDVVVAR